MYIFILISLCHLFDHYSVTIIYIYIVAMVTSVIGYMYIIVLDNV